MRLAFAFALLPLIILPALANPPAPAPLRVWEGYLYRDRARRLQIGWPVVAMGVMAQPDHVVAGDLAKRLGPLVSPVKDSYVFWNYSLEKSDEEALAAVPRILVRIRGRVVEGKDHSGYGGGPRRLESGELLSVEFVSREWLLAWARIFRDEQSCFRIDFERAKLTDKDHRAFAPRALATLLAMRKAPGATKEQRALVAKIEPSAKVTDRFRRRTEQGIQRWLVDARKKHGLHLPGLAKLGPLPPSNTEIQRWFLASPDRDTFLARVAKGYSGDLDDLTLVHYVKEGNRIWYATSTLGEVKAWSEALYAKRLALTEETLER